MENIKEKIKTELTFCELECGKLFKKEDTKGDYLLLQGEIKAYKRILGWLKN